jgi:hypothetical protein
MEFEIKGYSVSYYVNNKYVGSVTISQPDRSEFGYSGRREDVLEQDLIIGKKKIKKGSVVKTELQKICGRLV